jgi:hypothetical protein
MITIQEILAHLLLKKGNKDSTAQTERRRRDSMKRLAKLTVLVVAVALLIPGLTYATMVGFEADDLFKLAEDGSATGEVVGQIFSKYEDLGSAYKYTYMLELYDGHGLTDAAGVNLVVFDWTGEFGGFATSADPILGTPVSDPALKLTFAAVVVPGAGASGEFWYKALASPSEGGVTVFDGGLDAIGTTTTAAGGTNGGGGSVPEPGTLLLLASGLLALVGASRLKTRC